MLQPAAMAPRERDAERKPKRADWSCHDESTPEDLCSLTDKPRRTASRHPGELRALFGIHIARIACAHDLEVNAPLKDILPPEPD